MQEYASKVESIEPVTVTISVTSALQLANLIRSLAGIDNSGVELFKPSTIATELNMYAEKVAGIDAVSIITSVYSAQTLANFIRGLSGIDGCGAASFVQALNTLGTASVDSFVNAFTEAGPKVSIAMNNMMVSIANSVVTNGHQISSAFITMINTIITTISSKQSAFSTVGTSLMLGLATGIISGSVAVKTNIISVMSNINNLILTKKGLCTSAGLQLMIGVASGINSGNSAVSSAVNIVMNKLISTINSRKGKFTSLGLELMRMLANGLRSSASTVNSALSAAMSNCSSTIRSYRSSFEAAGKYLGDGLVVGINSKKTAAYNAGFALGRAAVQGEKDGQQSKSPSKLTKKAGRWLGEGLVIGISQMGTAVYNAGKNMGTKAVDSISGALASIQSISEDRLDMAPTLRPVVDLDNLQNGSETLRIGADLSASLLSGPVTTLKDIISDAQSSINASNNEVVQAIGDLRNDMREYYSGADTEIALYADMNKLASSLAKPMNRQLLELQKRGSR